MKNYFYILFAILYISCDSDDEVETIVEPFRADVFVNLTTLDGRINNDEEIQIDFIIYDSANQFDFIEYQWVYTSDDTTILGEKNQFQKLIFKRVSDVYSYSYIIPEADLYSLLLIDPDSLFQNDQIDFTWKIFNSTEDLVEENQSEVKIKIDCSIQDDFLTGRYIVESLNNCIIFGCNNNIKEDTILIAKSDEKDHRELPLIYIEIFDFDLKIKFTCSGIYVPSQNIEAGCGGPGVGFKSDQISPFIYEDDSTIKFEFISDYMNECGIRSTEEVTLRKIE